MKTFSDIFFPFFPTLPAGYQGKKKGEDFLEQVLAYTKWMCEVCDDLGSLHPSFTF